MAQSVVLLFFEFILAPGKKRNKIVNNWGINHGERIENRDVSTIELSYGSHVKGHNHDVKYAYDCFSFD